ncbi:gibberellic acid methyltransferase 1-like isoform X2 [Brassica napus]|uniref:gibberellic acid methyltransferase 1-like isoform X2 n=1 Tax=Brassica napus TaxID=3708 RepID=UPI002078BA9F|nr:gibberellic acid methyltransferase 1-like isoform X2 [Brassica napus]
MDSSRSLEYVLSMQGGDDDVSYAKNSYGPAAALASSKTMLTSAIDSIKLTKGGSSLIKIADLGCAVGDNTFSTVDTVIEALSRKVTVSDGKSDQPEPELEVFFSDLPSNDFNTLFRSLEDKVNSSSHKYFAAGVPGSFYGRLFPKGELHVVVTTSALQWLSQVPEKVMEKGSKTWNKGRAWIQGAEGDVVEAYAEQSDKDLVQFLKCRKEEIVEGGVLFMLMGGRPSGLVSQGLIEEEKRDGFNIPVYLRSTEEIASAVDRCGGFRIEKMEVLKIADPMNAKQQELKDPESYGLAMANSVQAGLKPMVEAYLGPDLTCKLFKQYAIRAAANKECLEKNYFYYMIAVSAIRV